MITAWTETYPVRSFDVDPDGLLTLTSLANFLQDAAGEHARRLGLSADDLAAERLTWFLAKLHVEVDERPAWREQVRVETWPSGHDGLRATREFVLHGPHGPFGRATSTWMMVHLGRRRPVRLVDAVTRLRVPARPRPLPTSPERLPDPGETDDPHRERVRRDDLDLNAHVNNVSYLRWVLEALAERGVTGTPRAFHLLFRAEAVAGDVVHVHTADEPAGVHFHRLTRRADDHLLALARTLVDDG